MKRTAVLTALVLLWAAEAEAETQAGDDSGGSRIGELLARDYEYLLISSGRNFPALNMARDHRGELTLLLHERVALSAIQSHFGWSRPEMQRRLDEMVEADLLRVNDGDRYVPAIMVMSIEDAAGYVRVPTSIVDEAAALIVSRLPDVRRQYGEVAGLRPMPFEAASLLVLSDVLLDNWQIDTVEARFLQARRPLRAGSRYYYSMLEKEPSSSTEAFGIYGNQDSGYGTVHVSVYGNRRPGNALNFLALDRDGLERVFGTRPDSVHAFKREMVRQFVETTLRSDEARPDYLPGFEALGWVREGKLRVPVLSDGDDAALYRMASLVSDDLIALLERSRASLTTAYAASPYAQEITFNEYFMFWYHLFYTAVTDRLIEEGVIIPPPTGIITYLTVSPG